MGRNLTTSFNLVTVVKPRAIFSPFIFVIPSRGVRDISITPFFS